jgi:hypothetical protein
MARYATLETRKDREMSFLLEVLEGAQPCLHLDFGLGKVILNF